MSVIFFWRHDPNVPEHQPAGSLFMKPYWSLGGVILPRNPTTIDIRAAKANVTYHVMASGARRRSQPLQKTASRSIDLMWDAGDRQLINTAFARINTHIAQSLVLAGVLPAFQAMVYVDQGDQTMSKEVYDPRTGQGGMRFDLKMSLEMMDPYFRSVGLIPSDMSVTNSFGPPMKTLMSQINPAHVALVQSYFNGPTGNAIADGLPVWDGNVWNNVLPGYATSQSFSMTNLGTAPWGGVIRFTGPFGHLALNVTYKDVDGTGHGVTWQWLGAGLAAGQYITYDTAQNRAWLFDGTNLTETFSWILRTGNLTDTVFTPWPLFPPAPSGEFTINVGYSGSDSINTGVDYTNNGQEQFRYW